MKTILRVGILGVALGAASILVVQAKPPADGGPGRGADGHFQRMAEYLGLSEEQQATWKSLHEQHRAEIQPLLQEGHELHQRLKAATQAENPDPAAVVAATLALKQHREKMKAANEAFQGQLAGTLTPDQKSKFEAFKASHKGGRRGHGRGPGGHRRQPGSTDAPAADGASVQG
jgi:Spy/CpxP family protein refolding chaperone